MKKLLVIFAAITLVVAFSLPAAAGDWGFYGSSRMATFMSSFDEDAGDDSDVGWGQQGNSRFGGKVKTGDISGKFEYGTGVNLRVLWGEWDYGGGSLGIGQNYTPVNVFKSSQVYGGDAGLLDVGGIYGGRLDMIQLNLKEAGLKVALVEPATDDLGTGGDVDTTLPKIELAWGKSFGAFSLNVVAGYNSYTIESLTVDESVASTVIGVGFGGSFGPANIGANAYMGTNTGQYGLWQQGAADAVADGTDVENCSTTGFLIAVGFKATETMNLELGAGSVSHTSDAAGIDEADTTMAYYAQATIPLAKTFFIVPEVGSYNYGDDNTGATEGTMTYFGAKWQMNF